MSSIEVLAMRRSRPVAARSGLMPVAALMLAGLVSACQTNGGTPLPPEFTSSVSTRHPIQVVEGSAVLDILPGGGPGGLTDRQVADIRSFGHEWRANGRGRVIVNMPSGGAADTRSAGALPTIRNTLLQAGVTSQAIAVMHYPASGPAHLAPVRLTFAKLEARLPTDCGHWQDDANGDKFGGAYNREYWNFGCAYQQNLAAMVADPEDFVRPRAEDPAYSPRRATVVGKYTKGEASATTYPDSDAKVSNVGQ
jgi:pilus assembly protein CpaD